MTCEKKYKIYHLRAISKKARKKCVPSYEVKVDILANKLGFLGKFPIRENLTEQHGTVWN